MLRLLSLSSKSLSCRRFYTVGNNNLTRQNDQNDQISKINQLSEPGEQNERYVICFGVKMTEKEFYDYRNKYSDQQWDDMCMAAEALLDHSGAF